MKRIHNTASIFALLLCTTAPLSGPAQSAESTTAPRVQLFAETSSGQLEALASGVVIDPDAKLRLRVQSSTPAKATVKVVSGAKSNTVAENVAVPAGQPQMVPAKGGFSVDGLSGDITVQVRLSGADNNGVTREWRLKTAMPLAMNVAKPSGAASINGKGPEGTLNVQPAALAYRPKHSVLQKLAMRGTEGEARTRGSVDVEVFRRWAPAVILVVTEHGSGSGVVIDRNQHLAVTNAHVVENFETVAVVFKPQTDDEAAVNSQAYPADVIKVNELADLALIRIRALPDYVPQIALGNLSSIPVGTDVHAIGHPDGELWTYTKGVVSQLRRGYQWAYDDKNVHQATMIQMQTPINPGNSGGPLLNDAGALVGINSMGKTVVDGQIAQLLNFAVSVDDVRSLIAMQTSWHFPAKEAKGQVARDQTGQGPASCTPARKPVDTKGDGSPDGYAEDANCDGTFELMVVDTDGDGQVETVYGGGNGDGRFEWAAVDEDGNGIPEIWYVDENGDGDPDTVARDTDGDGKPDIYRKVAG